MSLYNYDYKDMMNVLENVLNYKRVGWYKLIKQLTAKIDGREMENNLEIRWMRRLKRLKWQYKMIEERYKLRD